MNEITPPFRRTCHDFLILLFISGLLLAGCNEVFEPWQENDSYHYSIYGFLDASADTQWVRVMPVRQDLFLEPNPIDVTVTLGKSGSEEVTVLNDSLFRYEQGTYAWNFWTTLDLEPNETYRLTATRSDGKFSFSDVTIPQDFPTPYISIIYSRSGSPTLTTVYIEGVEQLADVRTVYRTHDNRSMVTVPHLKDTSRVAFFDEYRVQLEPQEDFTQLNTYFPLSYRMPNIREAQTGQFIIGDFQKHIYIAAGPPGYPEFATMHESVESLHLGYSNVSNGTGYIAGIVSKTIPFRRCNQGDSTIVIPCETESSPW
ncbi:MAG: hypothetical protein WD355_04385 [Balneolaceae bacterium]